MLSFIVNRWLAITLLILIVITTLSLWPLQNLPRVPGSDKTHHLIAYAILVVPAALANTNLSRWLVIVFILWSGLVELVQPHVNRYGEWSDMIANVSGIAIGWVLGMFIRLKYLKAD